MEQPIPATSIPPVSPPGESRQSFIVKKRKWFLIIGAVVLLIAIGGYFIFKYFLSGTSSPQTSQQPLGALPFSDDLSPSSSVIPSTFTAGNYTCKNCTKSHAWYIDDKHMLWWDGQPYIPYTGFAIKDISNSFNLTDLNIWIDSDAGNIYKDPAKLDAITTSVSNSGGTFNAIFLTGPIIKDASKLFDPAVKQQIIDSWKPYAAAVSKDGLRAMVIWNEINNDFTWPNTYTADQYRQKLGEYTKELKAMVGNVPVIFKIVDFGTFKPNNYDNVIAAGASQYADGIGFDIFIKDACNSGSRINSSLNEALYKLEAKQNKTKLFWIAELGGQGDEVACKGQDYWCNFPPLSSQADTKCLLEKLAESGAKGFIYNGPGYDGKFANYYNSYVWFSGFRNEIIQKAEVTIYQPVPVVETDNQESGSNDKSSCYVNCMAEKGNTDTTCQNWCAKQSE